MILEEGKEYQLTKELMPLLNLTAHSIKSRKEDLLIWFENFFDFEVVKQKPFTIKILKIKEEYQPLPRKVEKNQLVKERRYDEFTYQALGEEFEPNSKSRVARQAIRSFGSGEFGHHDYKKVVERYVSKPFNKYAETNDEQVYGGVVIKEIYKAEYDRKFSTKIDQIYLHEVQKNSGFSSVSGIAENK